MRIASAHRALGSRDDAGIRLDVRVAARQRDDLPAETRAARTRSVISTVADGLSEATRSANSSAIPPFPFSRDFVASRDGR